jgi:hypothetical protein
VRSTLLPLAHALATAVTMPLALAAAFALAELGALLAFVGAVLGPAVLVGSPFAVPLLHFHWQPADRKSALLALATGLGSLALGYTLCVWLWSTGLAPK